MEVKEKNTPNAEQQKGIHRTEGPVMLLAGPGTGKTYTLIRRVEKILEKGVDPSNILCLTFSDAATSEMKTRLTNKLGIKGAGVNVYTYHAFCMDIIRQNPEEFEMTKNVQMADDITKQTILKECIDEYKDIKYLKNQWGNKYYYIPAILTGIETIKRERTTEKEYFEYIKTSLDWQKKLDDLNLELKERILKKKPTEPCEKKIEKIESKIGKAKEFYSIYQIYKRKLNENNLLDYSDMINFVLDKMDTDEEFLESTTKNYKYVLVDEYQDTSKVQNELIFNILKGAKTDNIFVVGDDDQIIYSFQGARTGNLNDFINKFPNRETICLTEDRRSTQTILDYAEKVIDADNFRLSKNKNLNISKKLTAKNESIIEKEQKIDFDIYADNIQEDNNIVRNIENLIKDGVKPSEIAIITRKNKPLKNFARLLKQKNIPYTLQKQTNAFDVSSFIQIYFYLKLLVNSYLEQDKLFGLLSFAPFKIEDKTLARILTESRKEEKPWIDIIKEIDCPSLKDFLKTFLYLKEKKSYLPLVAYLHEIITKTGILQYYSNTKEDRFENIEAIQRLIDEAHSYSVIHKGAFLNEFVSHLDAYFKEDIEIELKKTNIISEAVQLVTYHGSKGREFEHVFMPNLTSSALENSRPSNREIALPIKKSLFSEDKDENKKAELLRLLFVGITRAKHGLHLSHANTCDGSPQSTSAYIPKDDNLVITKAHSIDMEEKIQELIVNIKVDFKEDSYLEEIKERVKNLTISQTSLNCYLCCPLQYFYSNILNVPVFVEDKDILEYGSAIHYAIQCMTENAMKTGVWSSKEVMLKSFFEKMNLSEFTSFEKKEELLKRGINSIEKNYPKFIESDPGHILATEYRMEMNFEGCVLKGFADRISKNNEGNILIYDFKTGLYKKVSSNENYYNQLRFYKFLYEEINKGQKVDNTALVFFEEGCKTSFPGQDETENAEIKEKIRSAIQGIKNLDFEPKKDENNCKYCAYKLTCKMYTNSFNSIS